MTDPAPKRKPRARKSNPPEPKRTAKPAQEIKNEKVPLTIETPEPNPVSEKKLTPKMTLGEDPYTDDGNRYAPRMKVGTPTIGRSPNYVKTVGLGNLQVTTVNGNSNIRSDSSGSTGTE